MKVKLILLFGQQNDDTLMFPSPEGNKALTLWVAADSNPRLFSPSTGRLFLLRFKVYSMKDYDCIILFIFHWRTAQDCISTFQRGNKRDLSRCECFIHTEIWKPKEATKSSEESKRPERKLNWSDEHSAGLNKRCLLLCNSLRTFSELWGNQTWIFIHKHQTPPISRAARKCSGLSCWNIEVLFGERPERSGTSDRVIHTRCLKTKRLNHNSHQNTNHCFYSNSQL